MSNIDKFISDNIKYLVGLIFIIGGVYVQNDYQTKEIERIKDRHGVDIKEMKSGWAIIEQRLQKKIKIMSDNSKEIVDLKMKVAILEEQKNCK